jgi:hypothetical protein
LNLLPVLFANECRLQAAGQEIQDATATRGALRAARGQSDQDHTGQCHGNSGVKGAEHPQILRRAHESDDRIVTRGLQERFFAPLKAFLDTRDGALIR